MEDQKENFKMPTLGFFMSIKHLRFPVVIKWKVLSHYAEQRNVHLNQKYSSSPRLTKSLSLPQSKIMLGFYSLINLPIKDSESSKLYNCQQYSANQCYEPKCQKFYVVKVLWSPP